MGSILYDYLTESILFDAASIEDGFSRFSDRDLERELAGYREFCLTHLDDLRAEVPSALPNCKMFSGRSGSTFGELLNTALYVDCHVLDDPLFPFTREVSPMHGVMHAAINEPPPQISRDKLAETLRFMRQVTPMVVANYVKFLPVSRVYEPPDPAAIYYSENYFSDALPQAVMDFFHKHARARSMKRADVGWVVRPELELCRGICIDFQGHNPREVMIYHLQEMKVLKADDETRIATIAMSLPDTPPDPDQFRAWVFQSINRTAQEVHNHLLAEYAASNECGAMYRAPTQFAFDLLQLLGARGGGDQAYATNALLAMDLPILRNVDASALMRVRAEEGDAFCNFRNALERGLASIRLEEDPDRLRAKTDTLQRELTELKLGEVDRELRSLRKSALAQASLAIVAMTGVVSATGVTLRASLLALAAAAFQGYKTYEDYKRQVRANPAFFLWKLKE